MTPLDVPAVAFASGDDMASLVHRVALVAPERVALIHGETTVAWGDLDREADRVASALTSIRIVKGDRVAVLAQNCAAYVAVFFGALRAGAVVVPLATLSSRESLQAMLADSGAKALFVGEDYADAVDVGDVVRARVVFGEARGAFEAYGAFLSRGDGPPPAVPISGSDAFDVIYSSGTTGVPKGIVHSHAARKASYAGSRARYFSEKSVNVVATPFYSNTTCITWLLTTAAGGTNVLLGKFSPDAFFDAVTRHRATHAMLVPVQHDRIIGSPRFAETDLSSLEVLFSTSAPLRAETKRAVLAHTRAELVEIYGLTEGGPVAVLEARKHPDKLATVGVAAPGTELRIVTDAGEEVRPGTTGEVIGRSANMMSGYLNRPEETEKLLFRDAAGTLFFRTGDIGRLDADGFLHLLDRKKDVIISGGFNVYATDIEAVLAPHPDVLEVAVIGVPSEAWGETPLALVVPRAGAAVTAASLRDYANERLGKMQRVSAVELREELPKNAIGKVLKRELRAPYWKT